MRKNWVFLVPAAIAGMIVFTFIGGTLVQLLWNWLMPPLFGLREVTFWQGLGLLALCRILFGGFGKGMHRGHHRRPEDRERFRAAVRRRFGFDPAATDVPSVGAN